MANYTTIKNFLKKLENKLGEADKFQHCGVILKDDYEKPMLSGARKGDKSNFGFLVVPRRLTEDEWISKYGVAL